MKSKPAHPTNAGTIPSAGQRLREAFNPPRRGEIAESFAQPTRSPAEVVSRDRTPEPNTGPKEFLRQM